MRHIAIEFGAYVVSVPQYIPRSAFPEDFPAELPNTEVFGRGGAAIIEPTQGDVIGGPLYDREGLVTAECDLRSGLHAKRWFDSVGHYSREDVLLGELEPAWESEASERAQDGSSSNSTSPTTTSSPGSKPARSSSAITPISRRRPSR
jgi:hypothetical protein